MDYRVCWTCQGLLVYDKSTYQEFNKHIRLCEENSVPRTPALESELYVCGRQDFYAMKQIKMFLMKHAEMLLERKKDLLVMGFSPEFVDSMLVLSKSKNILQEKNLGCNVREDSSSSGENTIFQVIVSSILTQEEKESEPGTNKDPSQNAIKGIEAADGNQELLTDEEKNILVKQCNYLQHGNIPEYECKLCSYRTKSCKLMLRHLSSHGENGQGFTCRHCNFFTIQRSKWNRHQCKKRETGILCNDCSESFRTKTQLSHHVASMHQNNGVKSNPPKVHKCNECPYIGRNMSSLIDHQRKHSGEYLFCDRPGCDFKSHYKRSLQQHMQKHATEKAQICHVCGFQTKYTPSLAKHMKLHEPTKQYKCGQCSYSSISPSDVFLHTQRKHLKVKKYSCSECPFKTGYPMAYKVHRTRHEQKRKEEAEGIQNKRKRKTKQYTCSSCGDIFETLAKVKKHTRHCCIQSALSTAINLTTDQNICEVFDKGDLYFEGQIVDDLSAEVYTLTRNMLDADCQAKNSFASLVDNSLRAAHIGQESYDKKETESVTCKGRNPMLAETSRTLAVERDSPLLEESLFNLMTDFPKPPNPNRCQSASTLMFASLSPHLVDRPLTPDFFSENPASSFFQSLSRNLDQDNLAVGSLP